VSRINTRTFQSVDFRLKIEIFKLKIGIALVDPSNPIFNLKSAICNFIVD
jgi:hypothetical protein